jgi:hypothetical protein
MSQRWFHRKKLNTSPFYVTYIHTRDLIWHRNRTDLAERATVTQQVTTHYSRLPTTTLYTIFLTVHDSQKLWAQCTLSKMLFSTLQITYTVKLYIANCYSVNAVLYKAVSICSFSYTSLGWQFNLASNFEHAIQFMGSQVTLYSCIYTQHSIYEIS